MPAAAGELIADCGLKRTAAKLSAQIRGSNHRFGCISEMRAIRGLMIFALISKNRVDTALREAARSARAKLFRRLPKSTT